jgi:hypothetical protein
MYPKPRAQLDQQVGDAIGQSDAVARVRERSEFRRIQRILRIDRIAAGGEVEQLPKATRTHRAHRQAHQETVEEGFGHLVVRHLVGSADHADQRAAHATRAIVELALVEQGQERVENGAVGAKHLVDEGDRRIGQETRSVAFVTVLLERTDRERPEQLFRHREARQQAFEVARIAKCVVQAPRQFALGRAGRTDQQRMLAGKRSEQRKAHLAATLDEAGFQLIQQSRQFHWQVFQSRPPLLAPSSHPIPVPKNDSQS